MTKEHVQELISSEFSKVIEDKKSDLVIVDFYAEWCMPCVMMSPIFESVAEKNSNVKFTKINVDEAAELAQKYEAMSIPCMIFFKEGKEVDRIVGTVTEDELEEKISSLVK